MKMYKCKIMGTVDSEGCYTCYMSRQNSGERTSRVLCKKANITGEVEVEEHAVVHEEVVST